MINLFIFKKLFKQDKMKQITLYLLLMLFSVTFCQNFIGIPDTNFEQYLMGHAGYDDNLDNIY